MTYDTELFDASTTGAMARRFQTLLESIVAEAEQRISELRLLVESETGGLSAEDFPEAGLSQGDFEELLIAIGEPPRAD